MLSHLLLTLPLMAGAGPAAKGYVVEVREARKVEATLSYGVRHETIEAREWVVYVPQAPELPCQAKPRTKTSVASKPVTVDQDGLKRTVLLIRIPAKTPALKKSYDLQVTFEAALMERRLRPLGSAEAAPKVAELADKERKALLASAGEIAHAPAEFRRWLGDKKLLREDGEADVDLARRVFKAIRSGFKYRYVADADRSCLGVVKAGASDCAGLSNLFAGAMRANGVPARTLVGRWAESSEPLDKQGKAFDHRYHTKCEFFARGVGWVPVDLSSAILHDRSAEGLRHFGNDPGNFIAFHVDDTVRLDSIHFGKQPIPSLQSPVHFVLCKGEPGPPKVQESWTVKDLK